MPKRYGHVHVGARPMRQDYDTIIQSNHGLTEKEKPRRSPETSVGSIINLLNRQLYNRAIIFNTKLIKHNNCA